MDSNTETLTFQEECDWNTDSSWLDFIQSLEPAIMAITVKYTQDEFLREDAMQNAKIELLGIFPSQIDGYEEYSRGQMTRAQWQEVLQSYCLNAARYEILSTLSSHTQGHIYVGRTQIVEIERPDGTIHRVKKQLPPRYTSLDALVDEQGFQVSDKGEISWTKVNDLGYGTD